MKNLMLPFPMTDEEAKTANRLAREQMKLKLLQDIHFDLKVCDIEGWDKKEYLRELRELINSVGGKLRIGLSVRFLICLRVGKD